MIDLDSPLVALFNEHPYVAYFLLVLFGIIKFILMIIDKVKHIPVIEPKLSKLLILQQQIGDKDKRLKDFVDIQINRELFKKSTGYFSNEVTKLLVDFYIQNNDKYSWEQIKSVGSGFEIKEGQLKLKIKKRYTRIAELFSYFYYGSFALLSVLLALFLPFLKTQFMVSLIPLFALLSLSVWMILREVYKDRIYNKMLLEPNLKCEVKTGPEEHLS